MIQIQKVSDLSKLTGINCILHAPSGFGKTYSIQTIPEPEKVLVLSAEEGLLSIRDTCPDMAAVKVSDINELRYIHEGFKAQSDEFKPYNTIVFDSLTEIAEFVLSSEKSKSKDGRQAYGEMAEKVQKLIRSFRSLPVNCIFNCHQGKIQDNTGKIFYMPEIPGQKSANKLPYLVDFVFCLRMIEKIENEESVTKRAFQTGITDELYYAKSRGTYLRTFEPPDWSVIYEKLGLV